jgi:hypothetical protein
MLAAMLFRSHQHLAANASGARHTKNTHGRRSRLKATSSTGMPIQLGIPHQSPTPSSRKRIDGSRKSSNIPDCHMREHAATPQAKISHRTTEAQSGGRRPGFATCELPPPSFSASTLHPSELATRRLTEGGALAASLLNVSYHLADLTRDGVRIVAARSVVQSLAANLACCSASRTFSPTATQRNAARLRLATGEQHGKLLDHFSTWRWHGWKSGLRRPL